MSAEPTIRDALIAEMLGDIGRLHEAVQQLNSTLPKEIEAAEVKLTEMIGLLNKAGAAYRQHVKSFTAKELKAARDQFQEDVDAAKAALASDISDAHADLDRNAEKALYGLTGSVHDAIQSSISDLLPTVLNTQRWTTAGLCLSSVLLGAVIALGLHFIVR